MNREKFFDLFHYKLKAANPKCDFCKKWPRKFLSVEHLETKYIYYICKNCFINTKTDYQVIMLVSDIDKSKRRDKK